MPHSLIRHPRAFHALAQATIPDFSPAIPHIVQPHRTLRWASRVSLSPLRCICDWGFLSLSSFSLQCTASETSGRSLNSLCINCSLSSVPSKVTLPSLVFVNCSFSPSTEATGSSREWAVSPNRGEAAGFVNTSLWMGTGADLKSSQYLQNVFFTELKWFNYNNSHAGSILCYPIFVVV